MYLNTIMKIHENEHIIYKNDPAFFWLGFLNVSFRDSYTRIY